MTNDQPEICVETRDHVATITLNRPSRRNALTPEGYRQLRDILGDLKRRPDEVRVVVVRGAGDTFCAGGDLDETVAQVLNQGPRVSFEFMQVAGELVRNLREMPQPVIVAVDGVAAGAGAALTLAADLRVLTERSSLAFVFSSIGLSGGDMGSAWLLQRHVGVSMASEILLLGDPIGASRAYELGLANRVVNPAQLDSTVEEIARKLVQRGRWGLQTTKDVLNRTASVDYATGLELETWSQSMLMTHVDFLDFADSWRARKAPATGADHSEGVE